MSVLDKTNEEGAGGNPLFLDVLSAIYLYRPDVKVVGGVYGLASKDFNSNSILSIYEDLEKEKCKDYFTVGIEDDVTFTSLPMKNYGLRTGGTKARCIMNWGFGGDGSVGAMTSTARLVADRTPNHV